MIAQVQMTEAEQPGWEANIAGVSENDEPLQMLPNEHWHSWHQPDCLQCHHCHDLLHGEQSQRCLLPRPKKQQGSMWWHQQYCQQLNQLYSSRTPRYLQMSRKSWQPSVWWEVHVQSHPVTVLLCAAMSASNDSLEQLTPGHSELPV